jgi:hypothetical protein
MPHNPESNRPMKPSSDLANTPNENATKHTGFVGGLIPEPAGEEHSRNPAGADEHGADHFRLAEALNRYYEVGCKTFTRHELLAYGGMDWSRVEKCLRAWESQGLIRIFKPLTGAQNGEIIAELLHPIV